MTREETTTAALQLAARVEPLTRAGAERLGRIARVLVDAALANVCVREYIRDLTPWHRCYGLWTTERVRANPPVRVEFEYAIVIGGIGEALAASRGKNTFGQFVGILPIETTDPVGELQINFIYKGTSPYNRRVEQRRWMKKRLGKRWRELVGEAMYHPKGKFLAEKITTDAAHIIRRFLGVDPGQFWRMARGKVLVELPKKPVQGTLFETEGTPDAA